MDAAFSEVVKVLGEAIKTLGFGVIVALWFMFRLEPRIEKLTDSLTELGKQIERMLDESRREGDA